MISSNIGKKIITKELPLIPKSPGVYQMLNEKMKFFMLEKQKIFQTDLKITYLKKIM